MYKERGHEEIQKDVVSGNRSREDIAINLIPSGRTEEYTQRLILEVLLDIRDLLKNIANK